MAPGAAELESAGDAVELAAEYGSVRGFGWAAEPLRVLPMINTMKIANTIPAANSSARRAQYVCAGSGPTGRSRPLMAPSLESATRTRLEARRGSELPQRRD
jgi:hypothetical protein